MKPYQEIKKYTESNRKAWNQTMPIHQKSNKNKWDTSFSTEGFSALGANELNDLLKIGITGKNIAHLCCNNGVELMSIKSLGANRCVGFDISELAVEEASSRCSNFGINCEFIQADVYDIPESYHEKFDLVYLSAGCIGWLPDLSSFFNKVSLLLNEKGHLYMHEIHPFSEMLPTDDNTDSDPLTIIEPYFKEEPYEDCEGIDYIGKTKYESEKSYWFVWKISDIINSIINNEMFLLEMIEYPNDISACHNRNMNAGVPVPLSYSMIARKSC